MPSECLRYSILVIPSRARIVDTEEIAEEEDGRLRIDAGRMEEGVFYRLSMDGEIFLARRYGRKVVIYEVLDGETLVAVPSCELEVGGET
jgi:hypothetical protein